MARMEASFLFMEDILMYKSNPFLVQKILFLSTSALFVTSDPDV